MIKPLLIICLAMFLTGCWQTADITDIKKAESYCETRDGVKSIDIYHSGGEYVNCVNGQSKDLESFLLLRVE